ncbi:HWE histidine kinase domain-containing protein [Caulobacter sp. NIBR1757]|uniref:HWE histidine kinase domain-containing protein n=1 Tax=Caulobacter sp. NIBR1757 TaxID=3016000 RepID=UPI0022F0732E|nr:HWE histidine kinase domain-containing protein [Caulobacter sp. NIBR1757]WGM37963.1 hypothetical protein AMEJIAPC_00864 [Caulobacter sp. NIBR1757]
MPFKSDPDLAALILSNMRGYGVLTFERDGTITNWLGDAQTLTGYAAEDVVGRHLSVLFTEPDRVAGSADIEIETALKLGRAEDSRWHQRKDGGKFWANGLTIPMTDGHRQLVKIFRDETAAKRAEDQRVLLLNELNHRVKNTLATVQSIVEQTLRGAGVDGHVRGDLADRLVALARAHNVLVSESWAGADLDVLIADVLAPHDRAPSPFALEGPPVRLHPSQAVTLSMSLHELVTNALKYGALSVAEGRVEIAWNLAHDGNGARHLVLMWKKRGGPPVVQPTRTGFGSRMLRSAFASQPGGRAELVFGPEGVTCVLAAGLIDDAQAPNDTVGAEPGPIG